MNTTEAPSRPLRIYIAGDLAQAENICREFCFRVGFCVTVSATNFIYRGGEERGVVVGIINYPRFPATLDELTARAEEIAQLLMQGLFQSSYTIEGPLKTVWYSRRELL